MIDRRLHWVDISKGTLILLMVCGHIPNIASRSGVDITFLSLYGLFAQFYVCFFMQAFFMLTGYTSSFDKEPKSFLVSAIKTIVIPWLSFSCILKLLNGLIFNDWSLLYEIGNQNFFFLIEDYWFLHALFISKVVYYFAYRFIKNDIIVGVLFFVFMIIGFKIMLNHNDSVIAYHYNNFLHYRDFLCMAIFIWIGDLFKRKSWLTNKVCNIALIVYVLLWSIYLFASKFHLENGIVTPIVLSHGCNMQSLLQIPAYMVYVITGSLACTRMCMLIKENVAFEYFGRNSIVVYCVHFLFIHIAIFVLSSFLTPNNLLSSIVYFALILTFTIGLSVLAIMLFTKRPFNYILGKF